MNIVVAVFLLLCGVLVFAWGHRLVKIMTVGRFHLDPDTSRENIVIIGTLLLLGGLVFLII